ncbi:U6 snRNA phosphodiesterase 1 isoform X2 [Prorops nasuta]|uniref:U6 snRNA phosphodiesterase 1 isoform X2 n=1 Tax=Prorops nasuta TaxID=863751 RepID=UPI0034CEB7E5
MSSLNLINTYSSDSDEADENNKSLPLPDSILKWQGVVHHTTIIDDPSQHGGRIRTFKHERGNWATLIYTNYVPSVFMQTWIETIGNQLSITGNTCFEQFHISFTRTLILKYHWIESFVDSLKKLCDKMSQFTLKILDFKLYCNEEKSRTFLGLECYNRDGILDQFVLALNNLLTEYNLPAFYEEASYHISLLWFLGDEKENLKRLIPPLTTKLNEFLTEYPEESYIHVDRIECKIGNKIYNFPLRSDHLK